MPVDKGVNYIFSIWTVTEQPVPEHVIMNAGGRGIGSSYSKTGHCKHPRAALNPSFSIKRPVNPSTRNATWSATCSSYNACWGQLKETCSIHITV